MRNNPLYLFLYNNNLVAIMVVNIKGKKPSRIFYLQKFASVMMYIR